MNNPYEFDITSNNKRKLQTDDKYIKKIKYSNKRKLIESYRPIKKITSSLEQSKALLQQ